MSTLKPWAPVLIALAVVAGIVTAAPSVTGGCGSCVQKAGDTMLGGLTTPNIDAGIISFTSTAAMMFSAGNVTAHGFTFIQGDANQVIESFGTTATGAFYASAGGYRTDVASGSNGLIFTVNGARVDLGTGSLDYWKSDGTNIIAGDGTEYVASGTPTTLSDVYINNIPSANFFYGGGTLPAHAFTVTAIRYYVRTAGTVGTTNATFQITDSTNTCNCAYACNAAVGSARTTCSAGAGTGCVFAASAALGYKWTGVGDCGPNTADIEGNIAVEGNWQ